MFYVIKKVKIIVIYLCFSYLIAIFAVVVWGYATSFK